MKILACKIIIKTSTSTVKFDYVNDVNIVTNINNFTDTCTVKVSKKYIHKERSITEYIRKGDKITVRLGYSGNLATLFKGYIKTVSTDSPLVITCENESTKLKQIKVAPKLYKSLKLSEFVAEYYMAVKTDIINGGYENNSDSTAITLNYYAKISAADPGYKCVMYVANSKSLEDFDAVIKRLYLSKLNLKISELVHYADLNNYQIATLSNNKENKFSKKTAFNRNFGVGWTDVARGGLNPGHIITEKVDIGRWPEPPMPMPMPIDWSGRVFTQGFNVGVNEVTLISVDVFVIKKDGTLVPAKQVLNYDIVQEKRLDGYYLMTKVNFFNSFYNDEFNTSGDNLGYLIYRYIR